MRRPSATTISVASDRNCRGGPEEVAEQLVRLCLVVAASVPFAEDAVEGAGHQRKVNRTSASTCIGTTSDSAAMWKKLTGSSIVFSTAICRT